MYDVSCQGNYAGAREVFEETLKMARQTAADAEELGSALNNLGRVLHKQVGFVGTRSKRTPPVCRVSTKPDERR